MGKKNAPKAQVVRKLFGTRMDVELVKKLKMLGAASDRAVYSLVEEGVVDLLKKYRQN